jgi:hypothetical protein
VGWKTAKLKPLAAPGDPELKNERKMDVNDQAVVQSESKGSRGI